MRQNTYIHKDQYAYICRIGFVFHNSDFNAKCRLNYLDENIRGMITIRDGRDFFIDADYVIFNEIRYNIKKIVKVSKNVREIIFERPKGVIYNAEI